MIAATPENSQRRHVDESDAAERHRQAQRRYNARLRGEPTSGVKCCLCPAFFDDIEAALGHLREHGRTLG